MPSSKQNALPVNNVEPVITLWKERNQYKKRYYTMWKLNPIYRTITLTKLLIKHAKLTSKETKIQA